MCPPCTKKTDLHRRYLAILHFFICIEVLSGRRATRVASTPYLECFRVALIHVRPTWSCSSNRGCPRLKLLATIARMSPGLVDTCKQRKTASKGKRASSRILKLEPCSHRRRSCSSSSSAYGSVITAWPSQSSFFPCFSHCRETVIRLWSMDLMSGGMP